MKKVNRFIVFLLFFFSTAFQVGQAQAQESGSISIIFLHHSTGQNLIEGGGVREGLTSLGYAFFDHGYNGDGLRLADGTWTGENFDVPGDNTDPDGFAEIFSQPLHDPPDNTFSYLMQYDVIAFKSCFPTSNIGDDAQLDAYKTYYLSIRDRADQYPEKLFVALTPPPQVPNNTNAQEGRRARAFADWLSSDEYLQGHPNLVTFNFFDLLAGGDHFLRPEYRADAWDAHPNDLANQTIGPIYVAFLDQAIRDYFGDQPPAAEEGVSPETEEPAPEVTESDLPPETTDGHQNMEEADWYTDTDGQSSITCQMDTDLMNLGSQSLHVEYTIGAEGYASCGRLFEGHQDWSGTDGVSFYLQSDQAGQDVTLTVFSGPLDSPVPFEAHFTTVVTSIDNWVLMGFAWSDFTKSDWYGEGGLASIDLTRIVSFAFGLESAEAHQGQFWVDGFSTYVGELPRDIVSEDSALPPDGPLVEEEGGGGICPLSGLILPLLGGLFIILQNRKQKLLDFN